MRFTTKDDWPTGRRVRILGFGEGSSWKIVESDWAGMTGETLGDHYMKLDEPIRCRGTIYSHLYSRDILIEFIDDPDGNY